MKGLRARWQALLQTRVRVAATPGELPPETGPPAKRDSVRQLLDQLKCGVPEEDTDAGKQARAALREGRFRQAEEILAGRATEGGEANILGIAYAHLAHDLPNAVLWQRAADAFAFAASRPNASGKASDCAKANRNAVEDFFALTADETV